MIKDFLILNCIGKNDMIGIKVDGKFYIHSFDQAIKKNDQLVSNILNLMKKHKVNFKNNFSISCFIKFFFYQQDIREYDYGCLFQQNLLC